MTYKPAAKSLRIANRATVAECGKYEPSGRDTAGQCCECHNAGASCLQSRDDREWLEERRQKGREYWQTRGIKVGDTLTAFARSMLGIGGATITGKACVGAVGAYVRSPMQRGYLQPQYFRAES